MIKLKRYKNRKYYSLTHKRYVNMKDLLKFISEGEEINAYDAATGDDLTYQILSSIIGEHSTSGNSTALHNFIRNNISFKGE